MINAVLFVAVIASASPENELLPLLQQVFARSAEHYKQLNEAAKPLRFGEMSQRKGRHNSCIYVPHGILTWKTGSRELDMRPIYWWTAGHFPGALWCLYEATGDAYFRDSAMEWMELLAPNADVTDNHDVGFIIYCSYGRARRQLKTAIYDKIIVKTAKSLCQRYNDKLGLIRSWGSIDDTKDFLVIPDNIMNLELLETATKISGDKRFACIARSHASITMKHHFRPDGGTYHVLNYSQKDGRVQEIRRGQGAQVGTAWSRGQSWAIYGYTMMYRESGKKEYLDFAQKAADFAINHPNMPSDGVPFWDFGAPGEERDSSAAAIMAAGLMELCGYVDATKGSRYRAFAARQLLTLASEDYFSTGDESGHFLLKHGVGSKPSGSEVDTSLDYGDYYFLEALLRFRGVR